VNVSAHSVTLEETGFTEALSLHQRWHRLWAECPELRTYITTIPDSTRQAHFKVLIEGKAEGSVMVCDPIVPWPRSIELRGFALAPFCPANTGSRAIALVAREVKRRWNDCVRLLTYAIAGGNMALYRGSSFSEVRRDGDFVLLHRAI